MTVSHIISCIADDNVGYSNSFTFSADGKTIYAINNAQDPENPEKSKMVFAAAEVEEIMADESNKDTNMLKKSIVVIISVLSILSVSGITTAVVMRKKNSKKK